MPVSLQEFSAACILVGVRPPRLQVSQGWYELHWTPDNWDAFVAVNKAYKTFDTTYALINGVAPKYTSFIPVHPNVFTLP
jgi:hypothetical protein